MNVLDRITRRLQYAFYPTEFDRTYRRWVKARGDATLRVDYPLSADSVVLDLGGYVGDWADAIVGKYGSKVHVFEPVHGFYEQIRGRFAGDSRVQAYEFGLATQDSEIEMHIDENSSSMARSVGSRKEKVCLRSIGAFLNEAKIQRIDLMKINIEGAEYDLLEGMIQAGHHSRVRDLQVQFHDFFPEAAGRRDRIREALSETHELTYDFPFIWENWRRK